MTPSLPEPLESPSDRFALQDTTLRQHTARGTIVNAIYLVAVNGLGLVRGFLVAAFVSRSDYGVWGILLVALTLFIWVRSIGIGDKYIQQSEEDQELAFQKAFTLEAMVSGALFVLIAVSLPLYALLIGRTEIIAPGLVAAFVLPAGVLQMPLAVFYRRMEFVRLRRLQIVEPLLGFAVTVGLAVAGAGYWSFVLGALVGAWATALMAFHAAPYPLAWRYDRGTLREYASFSWPLLVAGLSGVVIAQGIVITGEMAVGLAGLGAITLANSISLYAGRADEIVTATLYPAICAVRDRLDVLHEVFVKSNRLAVMWGLPLGAAIALFAPDLVEFGIGEEWRPAVGLIQVFGICAAVNQIGFNWSAFFRARGETRPIAVLHVSLLLVVLAVALPLLASDGLDGFAIGAAAMAATGLAVRWYYVKRLFPGFSMARYILRAGAPSVFAVGLVLLARMIESGDRTLARALVELAAYLLVTVAATCLFERKLLREVAGYLLRRPVAEAPQVAT